MFLPLDPPKSDWFMNCRLKLDAKGRSLRVMVFRDLCLTHNASVVCQLNIFAYINGFLCSGVFLHLYNSLKVAPLSTAYTKAEPLLREQCSVADAGHVSILKAILLPSLFIILGDDSALVEQPSPQACHAAHVPQPTDICIPPPGGLVHG